MRTQDGKSSPRDFNYIYHTEVSYLLFHCRTTQFQDVFLARTKGAGLSALARDCPGFGSPGPVSQEVISPGEALPVVHPTQTSPCVSIPLPPDPGTAEMGRELMSFQLVLF